MKKYIFIITCFLLCLGASQVFAQTQSGCVVTFPNNFDNQVNFSSIYNPALCASGNVVLDNVNDKNGVSTVTFDSNITLNSLTVNYKNGNNPLEFIIPTGITVTIQNDLIFNVSSAPQAKFLTVDGVLDVGQTIDFGGINYEIDGSGSINADAIIGADNVQCTSDDTGSPDCPNITSNTCDDGGSGACNTEGLPVTLAYFDVTGKENSVIINWVTSTEENNDYFEILRSRDGVDYNVIATIDGAGNSTQALSYEYIDNKPLFGQSYYKLKQTDFDGKNETFSAKSVYVSTLSDLVFSPNPVESGNSINIYTGANSDETVKVEVLTVAGKTVITEKIEGGQTDLSIPSEVERGVYFLKVKSGSNQFVKRLLIK